MIQANLRSRLNVLTVAALVLIPGASTHARADQSDEDENARKTESREVSPANVREESAPPAPPVPRPGDEQKVFVIRHVRPAYLASLLSVFPAQISSVDQKGRDGGFAALAVSAKPAVLAAIEETIKRLDQPGTQTEGSTSNVEITGYVLEGSAGPEPSVPLRPELEGVVAQLRKTFQYRAYRLLETVVARARGDGSGFQMKGVTETRLSPLAPSYYELEAGGTSVTGDAPRVVRLSRFAFSLQIPVPLGPQPSDDSKQVPYQYKSIGLGTNVDLGEGQYAVVGKSGLGGSDNALVLVLTAKVVD